MILEGKYRRIMKQMYAENKAQTLSREHKGRFEHDCAMKFAPYKKEFKRKEQNSRTYSAMSESGLLQITQPNNIYQRIKNYFSKT